MVPPSLHRYLYGYANPIRNVDPSGEATVSVLGFEFEVPDELVDLVIAGINIATGAAQEIDDDVDQIREVSEDPIAPLLDLAGRAREVSDRSLEGALDATAALVVEGADGFLEARQGLIESSSSLLRSELTRTARSVPVANALSRLGDAHVLAVEGSTGEAQREFGAALVQVGQDAIALFGLRGAIRGGQTSRASGLGQASRSDSLLVNGPGVNVTARADALAYRQIIAGGRRGAGTPLTDLRAVERVIGRIPDGPRVTITTAQAAALEEALGLPTGRLAVESQDVVQ